MDAETTGGRFRVLVADTREEVRSALRLLLSEQPDLEVVAEASAADGLLAAAQAANPDLVLVEWQLPSSPAQRFPTVESFRSCVANLRSRLPGKTVVVLGGWPELRSAAMDTGADAYVSKCDPPERVLGALREALATVTWSQG